MGSPRIRCRTGSVVFPGELPPGMARVKSCSEGEGSNSGDDGGAEGGHAGGSIKAIAGDGPCERLLILGSHHVVSVDGNLSFQPGIAELLGALDLFWSNGGGAIDLGASSLPGNGGRVDSGAVQGGVGVRAGVGRCHIGISGASPAKLFESPQVAIACGLFSSLGGGISVGGGSEKGKCDSTHL